MNSIINGNLVSFKELEKKDGVNLLSESNRQTLPVTCFNITCKDIYGERHCYKYKVMFRIMPTLQSEFDYSEEKFYLKLENI